MSSFHPPPPPRGMRWAVAAYVVGAILLALALLELLIAPLVREARDGAPFPAARVTARSSPRMSPPSPVEDGLAPILESPGAEQPFPLASVSPLSGGAPGRVHLLPRAEHEVAADGLPVNAFHCAGDDAGVFTCGGCRRDEDCPAGRGCVANAQSHLFECLDSECEQDAHCPEATVCRVVSSLEAPRLIRRCLPVGERAAGEPCDLAFLSRAGACQEGLLCFAGFCRVACGPEAVAPCADGTSCTPGPRGPACVPERGCWPGSCPADTQCKQLGEGGRFECLGSVLGECPEKPCPEGEHCNMRLGRGAGVFWCARRCEPSLPDSCAPGEGCMTRGAASSCHKRCDVRDLSSCPPGQLCTSESGNAELSRWGCQPYREE